MAGKMYEKRPEEDARSPDTWRLLKKYRDVTWSLELSIRQVKNQFRIDYDCSIEDFLESIYMAGGSRRHGHRKSCQVHRAQLQNADPA